MLFSARFRMSVYKLYSKQQQAPKEPVELRYDVLPSQLRRQIFTILDGIMGAGSLFDETLAGDVYLKAEEILRHEYGVSRLILDDKLHPLSHLLTGASLRQFFNEAPVDKCLDVIQVILSEIKIAMKKGAVRRKRPTMSLKAGIAELNARFKEHGLGFRYEDGIIVRIDSEFAHQHGTVPAMTLLRQPHFQGADQEFRSAQEHFRHARYKECLNECLKAFESTMKAICHKRNWVYEQNHTAKNLIKICEVNGLFPVFLESHLTGLRVVLESGVPTARSKTSAHGQGVTPTTVSEEFATYILNLTAANLLFLASAEQKLK